MRLIHMIERLQELHAEHGDMFVFLDVTPDGLIEPEEIDVDADNTGIIIWGAEKEDAA